MDPLYDMHCHLGWFADAAAVAHEAAAANLHVFANTVTPTEYARATATFAACDNVVVGVGAHPWWVADGRLAAGDVDRATELAHGHVYVGEVGLDFSNAHTPADSHDAQVSALGRILAACDAGAREGGRKLVSLHAVRSAGVVLELLERSGCARSCACVLHWFSGTSDELHRGVVLGCHFSVNEMMLATRRGREYARQLPAEQLLLETDLPPGEGSTTTAADIAASLERTLAMLGDIRGDDLCMTTSANAAALLEGIGR